MRHAARSHLLTHARGSSSLGRTATGQVAFNAPLHLGKFRGRRRPDEHKAALSHELQLQANDVVVLGTDGIFDNIFKDDLVKFLEPRLVTARRCVGRGRTRPKARGGWAHLHLGTAGREEKKNAAWVRKAIWRRSTAS